MNNSGNLLAGALRSSLGKEFWKADPVQEVSIKVSLAFRPRGTYGNSFFFLRNRGAGRVSVVSLSLAFGLVCSKLSEG